MYEYKDLYTLDFSNAKTYWDFHLIIKEELDFPDYYGCNWDALWDCLTDMIDDDPVHIQIIGLDNIEQTYGKNFADMLIEILKEFKHYANDKYCDRIQIDIIMGETEITLN